MTPEQILSTCEKLGLSVSLKSDMLHVVPAPPSGLAAVMRSEKPFLTQHLRLMAEEAWAQRVIDSANRVLAGEITFEDHIKEVGTP